jgi:prolipoprotein diacylglyceryltransferase
LQLAPQIANTSIPAPKTTKTVEKYQFWQNMSIILMSRVFFQLINKKQKEKKNQKLKINLKFKME